MNVDAIDHAVKLLRRLEQFGEVDFTSLYRMLDDVMQDAYTRGYNQGRASTFAAGQQQPPVTQQPPAPSEWDDEDAAELINWNDTRIRSNDEIGSERTYDQGYIDGLEQGLDHKQVDEAFARHFPKESAEAWPDMMAPTSAHVPQDRDSADECDCSRCRDMNFTALGH
jgi:hypothetical protein